MNWTIFAIALLLVGAIDRSFLPVFEVRGVVPTLVPALVAFVAMHAARPTAMWAGFLCGLTVDLLGPVPVEGMALVVPGPWALGLALAAWTGVQLRGILFRRSPAAFALLTFLTGLLASLVWTFVFAMRGWYPGEDFPWPGSALGNLTTRILDALASGVLAIPLWWPLERWIGWWTFPLPALRRR
ncbi:MAG: hypothetical protein O2819_07100 [Planctomycetota bacterium]|nr:hypothetical protein [Planctomycetota bacterium]MDA1106052.1 hypothetical protein [Planctomycetota bacterium]